MLNENLIKGQIIELKVQEELLRYGFDISIPSYNASKYDLIADTGKELLKIQVKKSISTSNSSFTFGCTTQNVKSSTKAKHKYTNDEIDYFATVWEDKVYLIPIDETSTQKTIKFEDETYLAQNILGAYERLSDNELYNPSVITEFVPAAAVEGTGEKASGEIRVVTTKQLTQNNSDNDIYNNIAEIVSFSNTVGRRDELAVPANAQIRRGEYIAATGYENGELVTDYNGAKEVEVNGTTLHLNGERDTDSPNLITVTEPTGISSRKYNERRYAVAIVISGVILVAGIVVIKKKIIKQFKTDKNN